MRPIPAACALAIVAISASGPASAALRGIRWRAVEHTIPPGADPEWDEFVAAYSPYSFDMLLLGDVGERVAGIDMGDASFPSASPNRLGTNGLVFNHSAGGDLRTPGFEDVDGLQGLRYDTFIALGDDVPGPDITITGQVDLHASGISDRIMRGSWLTQDEATLVAGPSGYGELRLMRVTVGFPIGIDPYIDGGVLGTIGVVGSGIGDTWEQSWLEVRLVGGEMERLIIGQAFELYPTPGGAALAGLAGLLGLRRRR